MIALSDSHVCCCVGMCVHRGVCVFVREREGGREREGERAVYER
jgi:hypothetical protein